MSHIYNIYTLTSLALDFFSGFLNSNDNYPSFDEFPPFENVQIWGLLLENRLRWDWWMRRWRCRRRRGWWSQWASGGGDHERGRLPRRGGWCFDGLLDIVWNLKVEARFGLQWQGGNTSRRRQGISVDHRAGSGSWKKKLLFNHGMRQNLDFDNIYKSTWLYHKLVTLLYIFD